MVFTRFEVIIRSIGLNNLIKTALWFRSQLCCLRSSEKWIIRVANTSQRTKPISKRRDVHCDWLILPLLLLTSTIWFSLACKWLNHKWNQKKMEKFCFFRLRICWAYDSDIWFSQGYKCSYKSAYDFDSDSFASENQFTSTFCYIITVEHKLMNYCSIQTLIYMNAAYTHVAAKTFLSNVQTETYWGSYQNLFE